MLRKPPEHLNPNKALDAIQEPTWTTLECQLVTPMYGGGVVSHTVDEKMPIRVSSIRGQLRFWWRLLATNSSDDLWQRDAGLSIRQAEADLWGGIDDKTKASKVFLRISYTAPFRPISHKDVGAKYVLFPADNETNASIPHNLVPAGFNWHLDIAYDNHIQNKQKQQVWEAIRWWGQFGGLGARTRRGLGAIQIIKINGTDAPPNLRNPISANEAQQAGCQLILRQQVQNNAVDAWKSAINKLRDFRQSPPIGRNEGKMHNRPGRSRWPEPDAIRRIAGRHAPEHEPQHRAGNLFPRAAFGLPIIFHFQGRGEPSDSSLQPMLGGSLKERMASPVILRPYLRADRGWASAALLLPHTHVDNLRLQIFKRDASYWNAEQAPNVQPIARNNGTDALSAFLNYFAK
ncbi:MAG: type III-B CRISPR module RAMP protein Cmr1 [Moraxellaceae bacterium]|nr:type III-B CRISPR module RAMP protein Cmr1 [Moraxellaceae bacterium]MCP5177333.1 type III-B CRISPR module RAMP protein Cmr1 [Moraxellaceae bacterium]